MLVQYKQFRIGTLFDIKKVYGEPMSKYPAGKFPYVTGAENDNGVVGYVNAPESAVSKGGCISVDPIKGFACWQPVDFVGRGFSGASINLLYNPNLNESSALFVCTAIEKVSKNVAAYTNLFNSSRLANAEISLPVVKRLVPDWQALSVVIGGGIDMCKIDTSSWKKFKLVDIVELSYGNKFDMNKMTFTNPSVKFVSRTGNNNGISDTVDEIPGVEPFPAGSLTLAFGGSIGSCFLQDAPFYTGQNVGVIQFPKEVSQDAKLFLASSIQKMCQSRFVTFSDEINKHFKTDLEVYLPATEQDVPDWEYMQERIAELEQERIAELEQYLVATGLNDYELTDEDREVLSLSGFRRDEGPDSAAAAGLRKEMREFRMGDLFDLFKGQRLTKADMLPGNTAFIGSTSMDNGVTGHIGQKPLFKENAITVSYNGSVGEVFYQEQPFWASDDINVLYLKHRELTMNIFCFLAGCIRRAGRAFSYTYKWHLERMRETMIQLPICTDAANNPVIDPAKTWHPDGYVPDWDFMSSYIRAIEKITVRDVVQYKDEMIRKTKQVVIHEIEGNGGNDVVS